MILTYGRAFLFAASAALFLLSDSSALLADDSPLDKRFDDLNRQFDDAFKEKHDTKLSRQLATQMIRLKPTSTRGYKNLAFCEEYEHNYKGALNAISNALKCEKNNAKCLAIRARVYAESDQDSLAKVDYEKALLTDSEGPDFYGDIAINLERLEDFEAALTAVKKGLKGKSDSEKMQRTAGRVLEKLNRPKEAEVYLKKAYQQSPNDRETIRDLAIVHNMMKQPAAVVEDTTSAIKLGEHGMHLVELYRLRAEALTSLGRLQLAKQDYDRCIEISPLQRTLFQARAAILQKLGDAKGASADLAKVKSLDSSLQPFNGF